MFYIISIFFNQFIFIIGIKYFIYRTLAAFLPLEQVTDLFGKNMLDEPGGVSRYKALAGIEGIKPFDCVGTVEESMLALYLAKERFIKDYSFNSLQLPSTSLRTGRSGQTAQDRPDRDLPVVLRELPVDEGEQYLDLLKAETGEHNIPRRFYSRK